VGLETSSTPTFSCARPAQKAPRHPTRVCPSTARVTLAMSDPPRMANRWRAPPVIPTSSSPPFPTTPFVSCVPIVPSRPTEAARADAPATAPLQWTKAANGMASVLRVPSPALDPVFSIFGLGWTPPHGHGPLGLCLVLEASIAVTTPQQRERTFPARTASRMSMMTIPTQYGRYLLEHRSLLGLRTELEPCSMDSTSLGRRRPTPPFHWSTFTLSDSSWEIHPLINWATLTQNGQPTTPCL
jgi:hypothetical protein